MSLKCGTFAILLLAGTTFLICQQAEAQNDTPPATATRPSPGGPQQTSVPNNAAPASRTQVTGQSDQDETIKKMNAKEKDRIEREGK